MTIDRLAEMGGVAAISAITTAGAMTEADISGLAVPLISGGIAVVVGYFSARMTMEREMGVIVERESNHFTEVMRRLRKIEDKIDAHRHESEDDGA
jgi:hypothetical protein